MLPGTIVALAAEKKSKDTSYLMKIACAESVKDHDDTDSFGNTVAKGTKHLEGYFLDSYNGVYRVSKKRAIFYKESVVYPFVQVTEGKKGFLLSNDQFLLITKFIEDSGCTALFRRN